VIPQWSARITALSRIALWEKDRDVFLRGGRVFMNDTDCVNSSIPFDDDWIHPTDLGAWKREYEREEITGAEYVLPKLYALFAADESKSIVRMKGVPRDLQNVETFRKLRNGQEIRKERHRTSQPKTVLRGLPKGGPLGIHMLDSVKKLRSVYDKRIVHDDGTTSPLVLMEGE
jgi:hypothetical protein